VHDGTCKGAWHTSQWPNERLAARARKKHPERAKQLEKIVTDTGTLYPKDFWKLETLACWTGGTVGHSARNLPDTYGDVAVRDLGYVSTEGRHTIPVADQTSDGLLVPDGAFYEFEDLDGSGELRLAHELEPGRAYGVVLSNAQGLYRYRIGDEVRCKGYAGQSPLLEFLQKSGEISDLEGEKISAIQLAEAMKIASARGHWPVPTFSAMPVRPDTGAPYYALLIERRQECDAQELAAYVDDALSAMNVMYRLKRSSGALGAVRVVHLNSGHWRAAARNAGRARGTGDTQYKDPLLLKPEAAPLVDVA
jgi:hypothetical protein